MSPVLLGTQIFIQIALAIYGFLYSPHNWLLTLMNIYLLVLTVLPTNIDSGVHLEKWYFKFFVIPGSIVLFSTLANVTEIQTSVYSQVGVPPPEVVFEGTAAAYQEMLKIYWLGALIQPAFRFFGAVNDAVRKWRIT